MTIDLVPALQRQWHFFRVFVPTVNMAALGVVAWVPGPLGSVGGGFEHNLMAWFTSVELVLAGFIAGLVFTLNRALAQPGRGGTSVWVWGAFALGLGYLGLDEYMQVHDHLDPVLTNLIWGNRYEVPLTLTACLIAGVFPAYLFWREWKGERVAVRWFALALGLSAAAILLDYEELGRLGAVPGFQIIDKYRWMTEDVLEFLAAGAFLMSFLRAWLQQVQACSRISHPDALPRGGRNPALNVGLGGRS